MPPTSNDDSPRPESDPDSSGSQIARSRQPDDQQLFLVSLLSSSALLALITALLGYALIPTIVVGVVFGPLTALSGRFLGRRLRKRIEFDPALGWALIVGLAFGIVGAIFGWSYPISPIAGPVAYAIQAVFAAVFGALIGALVGGLCGLLAGIPVWCAGIILRRRGETDSEPISRTGE